MKLFSASGIEVKTDFLSLVVFAYLIYMGILQQFFLMFVAFTLHELSHIFSARSFGLNVRSIRLTPLGGVAEIESFYDVEDKTEFYVAIAGPIMNISLAALTSMLIRYTGAVSKDMENFIYINTLLAGINLIPALPLDGGHAIKIIMQRIMDEKKAQMLLYYLSISLGIVFISVSAYSLYIENLSLNGLVLGILILFNAIKEKDNKTYTLAKGVASKKQKLDRQRYINVNPIAVNNREKISDIVGNFSPTKYNVVAVLNDDMQLTRFLGEEEILKGAIDKGSQTSLGKLKDSSICKR